VERGGLEFPNLLDFMYELTVKDPVSIVQHAPIEEE